MENKATRAFRFCDYLPADRFETNAKHCIIVLDSSYMFEYMLCCRSHVIEGLHTVKTRSFYF